MGSKAVFKTMIERSRMIREWKTWVDKLASATKRLLPDAEVYVIGSIARGEAIASSDVDVLIITSKAPEKPRDIAELKTRIEEEAGLPLHHPIEMHIVNPREGEEYLRKTRTYIRISVKENKLHKT